MVDPVTVRLSNDAYGVPAYQRRPLNRRQQAIRLVPIDPIARDEERQEEARAAANDALSPLQEAGILGALGDLAEAKLAIVRIFETGGKQTAREAFSRIDLAMTRLRGVAQIPAG